MYSPESIQSLVDRIGFAEPINSDFAITISGEVILSNSGRYVNSFHQLATVENLYSAVSQINMAELDFNKYLQGIKTQAVQEALTEIIAKDSRSDVATDYSNIIIANPYIFDDVIGYTIAIKCLELFISSSRKNLIERNAKLAISSLKVELEGMKTESGVTVAQGIKRERYYAIKKAKEVLFPFLIPINGTKAW